ncbi:hypothetical protein [Chitinophaga sp. Ak27]|uniref:hypothetical protein n=1 Tax=Chitinophaga sp. Ak27 TaxID=2726116 RepID=UPI00145EAA39|nr:hypothetical protein [Chitinophaga sp. Ak27]NLU95795.1 hypothetical protein [Chitinophaga sp. Ak27]
MLLDGIRDAKIVPELLSLSSYALTKRVVIGDFGARRGKSGDGSGGLQLVKKS